MDSVENIKVSFVVAIYKVAPYLDKLIVSILNQTHRNIEVILVDDGSPDECGVICDRYAEQDSRITVLHKINGGGCDARNKGMELVTGEYFTIVDGDDWIEPDFVEYLLGLAVSMKAEMAMTDSVFTTRDSKQNDTDSIEQWTGEDAATAIIALRFPMGCWNKLYKTDMVRRNHLTFSVPWFGEGMYFCTMAAQFANHVAKGHRRIYHYRQNNPDSSVTTANVQNRINGLWNIKNIYRVSVIRTPKFLHTVKWHIWSSYNYFLLSIVASQSYTKYLCEFFSCLFMIRWLLPGVLLHGDRFSRKQKWSMFKHAVFPIHYAKRQIAFEKEQLERDIQNLEL